MQFSKKKVSKSCNTSECLRETECFTHTNVYRHHNVIPSSLSRCIHKRCELKIIFLLLFPPHFLSYFDVRVCVFVKITTFLCMRDKMSNHINLQQCSMSDLFLSNFFLFFHRNVFQLHNVHGCVVSSFNNINIKLSSS